MDVFPSGHDRGRSIITVTGDIDLGTAENLRVRLTTLVATRRAATREHTAQPGATA